MTDPTVVDLHVRELGDQGPAAVLLHGLFGSGDNLAGLGAALAEHYRVLLVDLRNHGRSGWSETMTLEAMAADVAALLKNRDLAPAVVVGHSLGGKVAMQLALQAPRLVDALVIADIAPVRYPPHHQQIFAGLGAVKLDRIESRADADKMLAGHVAEPTVRGFLLKSLTAEGRQAPRARAAEDQEQDQEQGRFHWRFHWRALERGYTDLSAVPEGQPFDKPALFIKGERSDYILPEYETAIRERFPRAVLQSIDGTGHWLHAEQPARFNDLVRDFLAQRDR